MKTVIFDLDGTLLYTLETIAYYCNKALTAYAHSPSPTENYRHFVGNGAKKLIERALSASGSYTEKDFSDVFNLYNKLYDAEPLYLTRPYDGILPLLERFKKEGVTVGILSNKPDTAVSGIVNHFFPGLYVASSGGKENVPLKPAPDAVNAMLDALGADRGETFFVGDSAVDILTGKNAALHTIGVAWGFRGEAELKEAGADKIAFTADDVYNTVMDF